MSVSIDWIHPNIRLEGPNIAGNPRVNEAPTPVPEVPFPFERLPWEIQARIFTLWLWKPGQLIHALSRLDSFVELATIPDDEELEHHSGLPRGFYWGKTHYNVTDDRREPNDVLRLLLVSKRFFFLGVHCFYGLNTFAFSSLGEFDRFCNGIGAARMARLQHLELTWQGNQYLTVPPRLNKDGEAAGISYSRRTYGLYALQDLYRLRTLVVHVNETGRAYVRRRYERDEVKVFMDRKTQGQPNQRMARSLRSLQGLDCIHQLRGLNWIRFYDLQRAVGGKGTPYTGERVDITDWSFVEDVTNVTTMEKTSSRVETSKLENLPSVFNNNQNDWAPSDQDWEIIKSYYIEEQARRSYDHLRRMGHHHDLDIPSNLSSTDPTEGNGTSDSDSDDSSDSDPGCSGDGRQKRPYRPRPRVKPCTRVPPVRRALGVGRTKSAHPRQRPEPSIEDILDDLHNQSDSESSESGGSDSELDSESTSNTDNSISLLTDDEEDDNNSVIVVDDSDSDSDSDSSDSLFVQQSTDGGDPNSPDASQGEREDSVIPIPWSPSLRSIWSSNLPSRPQTSRRRDSTSSGLFVSQSPNRSPSVKSEIIMLDRANETIDLTADEVATTPDLPAIMEIDDDEDAPEVIQPPSPTGSKRSSGDRNTPDEGDDSDAPSPSKRPRTSSPQDRPADGDGPDDDVRAVSI